MRTADEQNPPPPPRGSVATDVRGQLGQIGRQAKAATEPGAGRRHSPARRRRRLLFINIPVAASQLSTSCRISSPGGGERGQPAGSAVVPCWWPRFRLSSAFIRTTGARRRASTGRGSPEDNNKAAVHNCLSRKEKMGILELFITACVPVLNMLLVTGVGSFLATDFAGILGKDARKHLNNVVFYVFNPALVLIYLAKTITLESFAKLWFMPVNILLVFVFGLVFGWIVIRVTRAPARLRGLVLGCCSAGNWGNIFLIIIPALCKEKGSPFGAPDVCQTYGLAYSSLSMAIGAVFLWTFVYNIVRATSKVTEGVGSDAQTDQAKVSEEDCSTSTDPKNDCTLPLIANNIPPRKQKVPLSEKARNFCSRVSETVDLKKLFAPSTIAVVVGFIIGATPVIRNAIIGNDAPLRVVQESAELIGGGAIPSVTLIMGANLINGLRGEAKVQKSIIAGVVVVRYILLPLLGTGLVKGAIRLGLIQPDPLYQFVLLLQYAVPPAMNIGTIMQLFGVGESECSMIFVWVYALASVAVTVWSAFFMWTLSSSA